jgi:hypothetical protein
LTLLVTRLNADYPHYAVMFNNFAVAADPLNRCHYFHGCFLLIYVTQPLI